MKTIEQEEEKRSFQTSRWGRISAKTATVSSENFPYYILIDGKLLQFSLEMRVGVRVIAQRE
jgi:hypothetical protein